PNPSLSGVSPARRGACQISGLWPGPADCLPGVVVGASTPGSTGPFHRLVRPATPSADPPAGLQHALFNTAEDSDILLYLTSFGLQKQLRLFIRRGRDCVP